MTFDDVCRKVVGAIRVPLEIGRWERAWEIVDEPSARLLAIGARMDAGEDALEEAKAAGNDVVRAWWRAAKEWEAEGRP